MKQKNAQDACTRCGQCCRNGGAALHVEDLELFRRDVLHTGHVLTLRAGEPAFDQPAGVVRPLAVELCKLAPGADGKACLFYESEKQGCGIYQERPLECRLLACWAPEDLTSRYQEGHLQRQDLLPAGSAALELARMHEERCSYATLRELAAAFAGAGQDAARVEAEILDLLALDQGMRRSLRERMGQEPFTPETARYCDFLFGRPMEASLGFFGLRLVHGGRGPRLLRTPRAAGRAAELVP
jgi:Fe-S-cluster containining protein